MVLTNKLLKYIFFVWIIFAFCFNAQGQDSLRVRTMGKGTTPNIALLNAKLSALNEAGWSADEQNFFDLEGKAFLSSRILDAKTLPDSSYQVILDSWVKTNYKPAVMGAGILVGIVVVSFSVLLFYSLEIAP